MMVENKGIQSLQSADVTQLWWNWTLDLIAF